MGKRKVKVAPQDFIAEVVQAISTACLTSGGVEAGHAELIGAGLGGAIRGISLADKGSSDIILSSLEKAINSIMDSESVELPYECRALLKKDLLSPWEIIRFMSQPDCCVALRLQITKIIRNSTDGDIKTFPIDDFISEIVECYEQEVCNNHDLASYANYCKLDHITERRDVFTANQQYIDSFVEPLFLHKNVKDSCVNLEKLFVLQDFEVSDPDKKTKQPTFEEEIANYIQDDESRFLFIIGDAGCGKTSLVAWMNYHCQRQDKIGYKLFGDHQLITIRLRDLDKNDISDNVNLATAIRKYLHLASLDDLENLFPRAIMILDGFDELCMVEGISYNHDRLLYELAESQLNNFKFIVTSRPNFISKGLNIHRTRYIRLKHFGVEQRELWCDRFTSKEYCNQTIDDKTYEYIKGISDDSLSCICDTPLTLYMLASKKEVSAFLENDWALYHNIFYMELSRTEYNKMFMDPDRRYSHDIAVLRDALYQVSEEIAYEMYRRRKKVFYLSRKDLLEIIERLSDRLPILKNANMKEVTAHCYALCCYWKTNSEEGGVEFLHNNIRDFFLAEKIYREMDEVIIQMRESPVVDTIKVIVEKICSLVCHGVLSEYVAEFILLRAKYNKKNQIIDFAQYEYENNLIGEILNYMSHNGEIYFDTLKDRKYYLRDPVHKIIGIVKCTVIIYRFIYEAYLNEGERICWLSTNDQSLTNILHSAFKLFFNYNSNISLCSKGYFVFLNSEMDMSKLNFQNSKIAGTAFAGINLSYCNFENVVFDNIRFVDADLKGASLKNATFISCEFVGVNLRGTVLPDGFVSEDQQQQEKHLLDLNQEKSNFIDSSIISFTYDSRKGKI